MYKQKSIPQKVPRVFARFVFSLIALFMVTKSADAEVASWVLFDADSGRVFDYHDPHRKWYPASLTKLMTAYVVFSAIREGEITMDTVVSVPQNVAEIPASKLGVKAGTKLTMENAVKIIVVKSANDISVGIAEAVSGSEEEFVAKMNLAADQLGMYQTNFTNSHGLPDEDQVSSARDMALLARTLWLEYPQFREYFQISGIRIGKKIHWSSNRDFLKRVEGAVGLKTGYICDSGFNLAAAANRDDRTIIAIILGAGSNLERTGFASKLIDAGFNAPKPRKAKKLTNFYPRSVVAEPPKKGYCRRNKPKVSELFAFAEIQDSSEDVFAEIAKVFANHESTSVASAIELPRKGNSGKLDWNKVVNTVIGLHKVEDRVDRVRIGVVDGSQSESLQGDKKSVALDPGRIVLPRKKPLKIDEEASELKAAQFMGNVKVLLPKPKPTY